VTTRAVDLPEYLVAELERQQVPDEEVHLVVVRAIEAWLRKRPETLPSSSKMMKERSSPFAESAILFIDQLIDENRSLFERLARLPDDTARAE
jgi:hypothetical protein